MNSGVPHTTETGEEPSVPDRRASESLNSRETIEWRRHSYKWYARVSYVQDNDVEVTRWLPGARLYPLDVDPNVVDADRAVWPPEVRQRW